MRVEQRLGVERDDPAHQAPVRRVGGGLDRHVDRPDERGQLARPEREARHHPERAPAAALEPPEELRVRARARDAHRAVGGDHLGLQQAGGGQAVALGEAAEASALDQARDADGEAAAALDVAARLRGHRVVGVPPHRAGLHRDRGLRGDAPDAAGGHEGIVQRDRAHGARPHQQGVRRARGPQVAVAAALHDQAQPVLAREVDRRDHVRGGAGRHRVDAGLGGPRVHPAEVLGEPHLVAEVVRVLHPPRELLAGLRLERAHALGERRLHADEPAPGALAEPLPRRRVGPLRVRRPHAAERTADRPGSGRAGRAAGRHHRGQPRQRGLREEGAPMHHVRPRVRRWRADARARRWHPPGAAASR